MLFACALTLLAAAPAPRLLYEQKCLYCHSESVAESQKRTEPQWRRLLERMRQKAPMLISRTETETLFRYITHDLKLVVMVKPPTPKAPPLIEEPREAVRPRVEPAPEPAPEPPPMPNVPAMEVAPFPSPRGIDAELEAHATEVIRSKCSRCHSLGRVFTRLDTFERSMTTLERMRLKTGSGITDADLELLERYVRAQFDAAE